MTLAEALGPAKSRFLVVILGPGEDKTDAFAKRRQVVEQLRDLGFEQAQLGEEFLGLPDIPLHAALNDRANEIDLALILESDAAPLVETVALSFSSLHKHKVILWVPSEFDPRGRRSTPGDLVRTFEYHIYSPAEFETCTVAGSMVEVAQRVVVQATLDSTRR